jgi:hypothetical protein
MYRLLLLAIITGVLAVGFGGTSVSANEQRCRMEQQCKWKNFKKICIWVRVCR